MFLLAPTPSPSSPLVPATEQAVSNANTALTVAIIGIVGTLIAAGVTQWVSWVREERKWKRDQDQDDKRWKRELEREQHRWEREREERAAQWRREDAARLHQHRLTLYETLVQASNAVADEADTLALRLHWLLDDEHVPLDWSDKFDAALRRFTQARAAIEIAGSPHVVQAAETFGAYANSVSGEAFRLMGIEIIIDKKAPIKTFKNHKEALVKNAEMLRAEIRHEIGSESITEESMAKLSPTAIAQRAESPNVASAAGT
jgi:hypothetical protein